MTTTTKIFVVLVCLFAFIFTPLAIQFAALTNDWQAIGLDSANKIETAVAEVQNARSLLHAEAAQKQRLLGKAYDSVNSLENQLAALQDEFNKAKGEYAKREQQNDAFAATTHRLSSQVTLLNTLNTELFAKQKQLVSDEQEQRTRANELADRVKELNTEVVLLKQQSYQLEETVSYLSAENEKLRKDLQLGPVGEIMTSSPKGQVTAETPAAWPGVRGEVTEVRGNAATINVGSNSGLQPEMKLVAFRGSELVCDLVVTENVTPNEAVATMQLVGGKRLQRGDAIIDEASLNKR